MLSLLYPDQLGVIVQGWLNAFKEGGWLPSWASPGYRNCMVGTYADVVVSDAIVKGVKGFDLKLAEAALRKDVSCFNFAGYIYIIYIFLILIAMLLTTISSQLNMYITGL
jgi:Glycosyl hydrolase family 92